MNKKEAIEFLMEEGLMVVDPCGNNHSSSNSGITLSKTFDGRYYLYGYQEADKSDNAPAQLVYLEENTFNEIYESFCNFEDLEWKEVK